MFTLTDAVYGRVCTGRHTTIPPNTTLQVDASWFAYSTLTVLSHNATHVSLALVYEGHDEDGIVGLVYTEITDFMPPTLLPKG